MTLTAAQVLGLIALARKQQPFTLADAAVCASLAALDMADHDEAGWFVTHAGKAWLARDGVQTEPMVEGM